MSTRFANVTLCILLLAAVACGGGSGTEPTPPPPPPPAPVASVAVTPDGQTIAPGATLQLQASVRDAQGQVLSGRTVTWSSSDVSKATVAGGLVTAVAEGAVVITASSEGKNGDAHLTIAAPPTVLQFTPETASAASALIGTEGGSVTTQATNGTTYTLSVPPEALAVATQITLTPLRGIQGLPLNSLAATAVKMEPSGLQFLVPAQLTLGLPGGGDPAKAVGFGFDDAGGTFSLIPASAVNGKAVVAISHFSGAGAAPGCPAPRLRIPAGASEEEKALAELADLQLKASCTGQPYDVISAAVILNDWRFISVDPGLAAARTNLSRLDGALREYLSWKRAVDHYDLVDLLPNESAQLRLKALAALKAAILKYNSDCASQTDPRAASEVLRWMTVAQQLGLDDPAEGLDAATVLSNICVKVVFQSADFASAPLAGEPATFNVKVGLSYLNSPPAYGQALKVIVTPSGTMNSSPIVGNTVQGDFATQVTPLQSTVVVVMTVSACIENPQYPRLRTICGTTTVTRNVPHTGQNACVTTSPTGYLTYGGSTPQTAPWTFSPGAQSFLTQAQADSVVSAARVLIGWLTEPGTPVVTGETVELKCLSIASLTLGMQQASAVVAKFPAIAQVGDPADRFASLHFIDNSRLTTIELGPAAISGYLIIRDNPELTDISKIAAGMTVGNKVEIGNNPKLCQSQIDALLARIATPGKNIYSNKGGC